MPIVFEKEKLKDILKQYYTLTKTRIAVFDEFRREIVAYPVELDSFCNTNRQDLEFLKLCNKSDLEAFNTADKTEGVYIYRCHCGLTEAVKSITQNGMIMGYIMFGQFKDGDLLTDKIKASAKIMEICVGYILSEKLLRLSYAGIGERIKKYLQANFSDNITISSLKQKFGLSHTTINTVLKREEGMGVIQYLNTIRLSKAAELLVKTHLAANQIAEKVGYLDPNYFSRAFKKHFHQTPTSFRRARL